MSWDKVTKLDIICPKHGKSKAVATFGGDIVCEVCCMDHNKVKDHRLFCEELNIKWVGDI